MPTGINTDNLEIVLEKIQNAIGKEYASNDPAILASYSRDFTIVPGKRPNIVVIPGSTEEVQKIVKIAIEHQVPVVPMSSGFNHGGLCIPLHGGIMLDLIKRMDKVLNVDEDSMTLTVQPGVRNAVSQAVANNYRAVDDVKLMPLLSLSMGSTSTLANYVARGIPCSACKHGYTTEAIVNMTWVLPDGELLKTGPSAVPNVGTVPIAYGPGPDIGGMFFNANGMFGICTEITIKLFPERKLERYYNLEQEVKERTLEKAIDVIRKVSRLDLAECYYKTHGAQMVNNMFDPDNPFPDGSMCEGVAEDPLLIVLSGDTEEEIDIKEEILLEIITECGMYVIDAGLLEVLYGSMEEFGFARKHRTKIGAQIAAVMRRGSFQWYASNIKADHIPEITNKFNRLLEKYWKPSDSEVSRIMSFSGTAIQGPYSFGRNMMFEFDYFWDPANPEDVKRGSVLMRKCAEMLVDSGAQLWRNHYHHGEIHLPRLGTYFEIIKQTKREFDPHNLMHPDIDPVTDDYI